MFAKNCWYVAALTREVGRTLLARTIANEQLIFYRTEAGQPVAM
ncbi:MAG: aromatic ring-hydroxylating dioxygenase subunit alpha, partial [Betaproteobacteria bacterium]|nr:aromatic ring-hydroxylating dioxygenase subunit alpha [Betaproteobacteria bacterium]